MMSASDKTLLSQALVESAIRHKGVCDLGKATIREVVTIVNELEERSGVQFIRMEMGVPGLSAAKIGVAAEIEALETGVASKYPMLEGIPEFKKQASNFIKAFLDVTVNPAGCIPTVGVMQASYILFMALNYLSTNKKKILFIDPGFPVQKQQLKVLGYEYISFDVFEYRGKRLKEKLESYLAVGDICGVAYSNPNNPTWICFSEEELKIIGELANKYNVTIVEDLAYFGMDFRKDISKPYKSPFQSTVAKYTKNYILLISSSKVFSYAGQRLGTMCISDKLFNSYFESLKIRYGVGNFGQVIVGRLLYSLSAGASHSAQCAIASLYKAACSGQYNIIEEVKEYGIRAGLMKKIFVNNGFDIVYDKDIDTPIADGFYFTIGYKGFTGGQLLKKLLCFGISAIALYNTGSKKEGLRACVSQTSRDRFPQLEERLNMFRQSLH